LPNFKYRDNIFYMNNLNIKNTGNFWFYFYGFRREG